MKTEHANIITKQNQNRPKHGTKQTPNNTTSEQHKIRTTQKQSKPQPEQHNIIIKPTPKTTH